ncbi:MAG: hypothetical protein JNG84_14855 [Archangium sp.]|nr:hypothetical protein [Archangium sp.]
MHVIPFRPGFELHSDDPSFTVERRGVASWTLSGEVSESPTTLLDVHVPGADAFDVPLATRTTPAHAVAALRRALPRHVMLFDAPEGDSIAVRLQETVIPAAKPPRLRIISTSLTQRVRQLEDNRVEFTGSSGAVSSLTILCDGRRVTLTLPANSSGAMTAARVGANMPPGYRALVDGAVVSVWKDADFFSMVA